MSRKLKDMVNALINERTDSAQSTLHEYLSESIQMILENRRTDITYKNKVMKGVIERVTVELEGNESGIFTRAAKRYKQMDRLLAAIQEKRNELNVEIKSKVLDYFDEGADEIYTRVIDTVSLTATVSKKQAGTPESSKDVIDYEKVVKKLMEMVPEIEAKAKELIEEFTEIETTPAKPGKEPSLSVKYKDEDGKKAALKSKADSMIDDMNEGVRDVFVSLKSKLKDFVKKFKAWGKSYDERLEQIKKEIR